MLLYLEAQDLSLKQDSLNQRRGPLLTSWLQTGSRGIE